MATPYRARNNPKSVRENLVFLGGTVLALYAGPSGSSLRVTADVDCLSTVRPWILQETYLARLCTDGILDPVPEQQQRYRVRDTGLLIDVISPDSMNVGGARKWLQVSAAYARLYDIGDGEQVKAVAPPYFVALKLDAFIDRGTDFLSSKDIEDIVFVAAEVPDIVEQVKVAGIASDIADLWQRALTKHNVAAADIADITDAHLGSQERPRLGSIAGVLRRLVEVA